MSRQIYFTICVVYSLPRVSSIYIYIYIFVCVCVKYSGFVHWQQEALGEVSVVVSLMKASSSVSFLRYWRYSMLLRKHGTVLELERLYWLMQKRKLILSWQGHRFNSTGYFEILYITSLPVNSGGDLDSLPFTVPDMPTLFFATFCV